MAEPEFIKPIEPVITPSANGHVSNGEVPERFPWWLTGYVAVLGMVVVWTVIGNFLRVDDNAGPSLIYVYLLIVSMAAFIWKLPHALFALLISVTAADLFVLPHTQTMDFRSHELRLIIFSLVAIALAVSQHRLAESRRSLNKRYETERDLAQLLQRALIPRSMPISNYDSSLLYEPAAKGSHIGGDFVDIFDAAGKVGLLLGDVTGHGPEAAVYTTEVRYTLKAYATEDHGPAECLAGVNRVVYQDEGFVRFATTFYAALDTSEHTLTYANAGHEPPLVWRNGAGTVERLRLGSLPLGIADSRVANYEDVVTPFEPGDVLLVYTDGVTEARRHGAFYGIERLEAALIRMHALSAKDAVACLFEELRHFASDGLRDDVAVLWVKRPESTSTPGELSGHQPPVRNAG
ncbi:MAG TPA: SpoIIE family protein phosphatase [Armatimonadota bacterium]|nr:SpoIIE family protein phosphatase [Armatimonadota bacterium]